jgi:hypothetical protein
MGKLGFHGIKMYGMVDGLVIFHSSRGKVSRENNPDNDQRISHAASIVV